MEERYFEDESFTGIKLDGAVLTAYEFVDCLFQDCTLDNCTLTRCRFAGCKFETCSVTNLTTEGSSLQYAAFTDCTLLGINWSLLQAQGRFVETIGKLQGCRLKYNSFTHMTFRKFDFSGTSVSDSIFGECALVESSFRKCQLERTEFFQCDLRKADFRDATGYRVDILSCKIKDARFSLPEAVNLLDCLDIRIE